ncbi:Tat pathway signal protein [Neokomagataea tanensis]|uniref:Tat pathway signal protein n=2 Tax=Neokomagataea TaxID=1223423 RepID=A0A4Y6VBJ1_9PROT|nr:Tat pathway signal protein [Neokomagataea tanensis]
MLASVGLSVLVSTSAVAADEAQKTDNTVNVSSQDAAFAEDLEQRTFQWFWQNSNPKNGLVPDRAPLPNGAASVASVGFGLTAYGIGAERGYISRDDAVERTLVTLRFMSNLPQNENITGSAGYRGFFYHFLDPNTGLRVADWSELSSIDTALFISGVLFAQSYYTHDTPHEAEIRKLAEGLYSRVDWAWMRNNGQWLSMGWYPTGKFISTPWKGYSEGLVLYLLALSSPTHPLPPEMWNQWTQSFAGQWASFEGRKFLNFAPLFGHQYSESWLDLRGIQDDFSRAHQTDYFQNSRAATYAQRDYAIRNPGKWKGYGPNLWGLTASDGPGEARQDDEGHSRHYLAYSARGAGADYILDDGTIAPTAAGGSVAFAPEIVLPALRSMHDQYGSRIYDQFGFKDAFNLTFKDHGQFWVDGQQLGIDQGPILLMLENWRSGFVWNVMRSNSHIRDGLTRAGFTGGWLAQP